MAGEEEMVEEEESANVAQLDLLTSYLAFGGRAIKKRQLLAVAVFVVLSGLTVVAVMVWPRTFHCESRLMAQRNDVLASERGTSGEPLRGAADVIFRHDNLEAIVKQTDLVRSWEAHRPPVFRLKDSLMGMLRGSPSESDQVAMLVGTLESKLSVNSTDASLTIGVDWSEPQMSAHIVETAQQNFLESRHVAEVSSIADYIAILEGHAAKLRSEIEGLAEQIQRMSEERLGQAERNAPRPAEGTAAPAPRRTFRPRLQVDEELPRLKVQLEAKKTSIAQFEEDRKRRVAELQARLNEFKARYTPAHPAVVDLEKQIASMSQDSPQLATLKAEAAQLEAEIKSRTQAYVDGSPRGEGAQAEPGPGGGAPGPGGAQPPGGSAGPLPTDIMQLMQNSADGLDPAIGAQFRYAVGKYTSVRDQISTARIDLDKAQAAFGYRYKIVTPPQVPLRPSKPKIPVMVGGGLAAALLLALLLPVLLELKTGKIVERWQVAQIRLPILAELKLPPGSPD
jgi:uncharacterized protein involved in exopolysaccharide biosynthesis